VVLDRNSLIMADLVPATGSSETTSAILVLQSAKGEEESEAIISKPGNLAGGVHFGTRA